MPFHKYMPEFIARQFRTISVDDFPGVLVPLESAQRHHSVSAAKPEKLDEKDVASSNNGDKLDDLHLNDAYDIHTIEGLKAEVEADVTAFGHDSAYDRTPFSPTSQSDLYPGTNVKI